MANLRDIRRRIRSVKNTAQITKAMQMVASSKMRKAQVAALAGRPYAETMNRMLAELLAVHGGDFTHPLMEPTALERAHAVVGHNKPMGWVAAAVIIAIWLLAAASVGMILASRTSVSSSRISSAIRG